MFGGLCNQMWFEIVLNRTITNARWINDCPLLFFSFAFLQLMWVYFLKPQHFLINSFQTYENI